MKFARPLNPQTLLALEGRRQGAGLTRVVEGRAALHEAVQVLSATARGSDGLTSSALAKTSIGAIDIA